MCALIANSPISLALLTHRSIAECAICDLNSFRCTLFARPFKSINCYMLLIYSAQLIFIASLAFYYSFYKLFFRIV